MIKSSRRDEDNIIKYVRNLFKIEKTEKRNKQYHNYRDKKSFQTGKIQNEAMKYRIIRDIRNLFEFEEHYYKQ